MIKFGKGNLRVPKWSKKVFLVAGGCTPFRKYFPEYKLEELVMMGYKMMLEDNDLKMSPKEIKDSIQFAVYGEFADHFQDQLLCEAKMHDYLGLDPLYNVGIKTGGATGGSAVLMGAQAIASGYANCVLASGWERMDEVDTRTGNFYISTAACKDFETRMGRIYSSYYAKVAVKNRGYAVSNPNAQQPGRHTVEEVLASPMSAYPLRFLECCAMTAGAASVLLCDEEMAYKLSDKPTELFICGGSHTLRVADRRHMEIPLLPHEEPGMYKDLLSESGRWPGFESFLAARFAAYLTYRMAGINDPLEDLDFVELHDAFTISDIQTYGDIGLRPYGQEPDYIESGDAYFGGKCPSNLSGGLLGTMHAVGATGIWQAVECLWQVQNKCDYFHGDEKWWKRAGKEKPSDYENLQVPDAKQGLWVSHAGVGSHVTVGILRKAW
jgi:acetyl-CoA C-acetyltransferase